MMEELLAIQKYNLKEILSYFQYPYSAEGMGLTDMTENFWKDLNADEVSFHEDYETILNMDGDHYSMEIYRDQIYRGEDYTLICVADNGESEELLVFKNSKEVLEGVI